MNSNHNCQPDPVYEYSAGGSLLCEINSTECLLVMNCRGNKYELPKGHIEHGETSRQAAIREFAEETGITIDLKIEKSLGSLSYPIRTKTQESIKRVDYYLFNYGHLDTDIIRSKVENTAILYWIEIAKLKNRNPRNASDWISVYLLDLLISEL